VWWVNTRYAGGTALGAAKKWRFEPAAAESTAVIDFKFEPR